MEPQSPASSRSARIDPVHHFALSQNRNPHLEWTDVPDGTQSFVLICHDDDVPSRPDDVNQEGREVPESLPRIEFFHWLLLDIPAETREISAGSQSDGVVPAWQEGTRRTSRPAPRHQRLHRLVRRQPGHEGDLHRLRWTRSARGTTASSTTTCSPSMRSTCPRLEVKGRAHRCQRARMRSPDTYWPKHRLMGTYTLNPRLHKN